MPIYEYRCESCDYTFDLLQKMADPAPAACPECGSPSIRRLISAVGFRLKGGGWYETDFKSGNQRNLHEGGEKDKGDAKGKSAAEGKSADSGTPAISSPANSQGATATST